MLDPQKASAIQAELKKALAQADKNLPAWLDWQIAKSDGKVVEDLLWVRRLLREEVVKPKPRKRRAKAG